MSANLRILLLLSAAVGAWSVPNSTCAQGGVPLWTNRVDAPANDDDRALAAAVDTSGNIYVTGFSSGDPARGNRGYLTVAYSSAGAPLWTNGYRGPSRFGGDQALALAVANDRVYVTGGSPALDGTGLEEYATIAYSAAGTPLWTNRYSGFWQSSAIAAAVAGNGNCIITGTSSNNIATLAYSSDGVALWTNR